MELLNSFGKDGWRISLYDMEARRKIIHDKIDEFRKLAIQLKRKRKLEQV